MVEVGTGGIGTKILKTEWPVEEGTTAGTTKLHGRVHKLEPERSVIKETEKVGLDNGW